MTALAVKKWTAFEYVLICQAPSFNNIMLGVLSYSLYSALDEALRAHYGQKPLLIETYSTASAAYECPSKICHMFWIQELDIRSWWGFGCGGRGSKQ